MSDTPSLIEIFLDEAQELLTALNAQLALYKSETQSVEVFRTLLRDLHTLKGGARMVGFIGLNEYIHAVEEYIKSYTLHPSVEGHEFVTTIQSCFDVIATAIDTIARSKEPDLSTALQHLKSIIVSQDFTVKSLKDNAHSNEKALKKNFVETEKPEGIVRVEIKALEKFSQLAEQVNIDRLNIEQQVKALNKKILDINKHSKILSEQMRALQNKTDLNLPLQQSTVFNHPGSEFDFLEMDHYSDFHKMTRLLSEESHVIMQVGSEAQQVLQHVESMLFKQKCTARNLEEKIIHTRMISIDKIIPRLERLTRQVSDELGKKVRLKCVRVQGQIDRKNLDKIVPSLEHIIRNSIDHGIEFPQQRKMKNKPEIGILTLAIFRQGNEIVIDLSDDGQGIDIAAIQNKAIEMKKWFAHQTMNQEEAIQFMLEPGFSTKQSVTPISGQGVGLDVVNTDVNLLGGKLQIMSHKDVGVKVRIRIPFTFSLSQALVFQSGSNLFAMPLSHLLGVKRMKEEDFKTFCGKKGAGYSYENQLFECFYLCDLMGFGIAIEAQENELKPILFLKSDEGHIAILIDRLVGSYEMVIKLPGPQLQFIREISGVSLLSDEKIVLVLDALSLIQKAKNHQHFEDRNLVAKSVKKEQIQVMVVDDSVTVREVTSRLLRRAGFDVLSALEGECALKKMQEKKPDIVLLDIEMPNMDGFEVLKTMKASVELQTIPVIMITSRSGEKHRLRSMQLGASDYLTKPFREEKLIQLIRNLVQQKERK